MNIRVHLLQLLKRPNIGCSYGTYSRNKNQDFQSRISQCTILLKMECSDHFALQHRLSFSDHVSTWPVCEVDLLLLGTFQNNLSDIGYFLVDK